MRLRGKIAVVTEPPAVWGEASRLHWPAKVSAWRCSGGGPGFLRVVARECAASGAKAIPYTVDLLKDREVRQLKQKVIRDFGGVDILVHSAGVIMR